MEVGTLIKRRKSSRTKHLFKKIKRKCHYHKHLTSSDTTLVEKNGSNLVLNGEIQELFIKKMEDRLNIPLLDKFNSDMLDTNQRYEQIIKFNEAIQDSLNELADRQNHTLEKMYKTIENQTIQSKEIEIQNKIISEQQTIIKELMIRNKDNESRLERMENILYDHQKKFIEMQKIIDRYNYKNEESEEEDEEEEEGEESEKEKEREKEMKKKNNCNKNNMSSKKKTNELYQLSSIEEESHESLSSIKLKYLVSDFLEKIEHCEKQEKNCVKQVNKLLNERHKETEKIHKIYEEIQKRINIFGVKRYDEIIDALNQYKKYVDIPISELIEIEKLDLSKNVFLQLKMDFQC